MKKAIIKTLSVLLAVVLTFTAAPLSGFVGLELPKWLDFSIMSIAAETSGTCGENLTWTLDDSTGTLTISGTGKMAEDFYYDNPWEDIRENIKIIIISDGVTTIGDYAFRYCTNLISVTIPNGVTTVGYEAFSFCENITSVTIPDSVTTIGYEAFASCTSLTSITIPETVTSIGGYAFSNTAYYYDTNKWENNALYIGNHLIRVNTDTLSDYEIKEGTLTIADYAFAWCDSLTNVTIPDSVTSVGECAFVECTNLTSIIIPDSIISIGRVAFADCTSLTSVKIPDNVKSIGDGAFSNSAYYNDTKKWEDNVLYIGNHLIEAKDDLSGNYEIKEGTLTIADCAFAGCDSLIEITISDGIKSIGEGVFQECYGLTEIIIPDSVTTIGDNAFCDCMNLTTVKIPDSVITIGCGAFCNCHNLASVSFPDGITTIGEVAFRDCDKLTNVTIPDSVMTIGEGAFDDCDKLISITVDSNNEYYSSDEYGVLFNKDKTALIKHPAGNLRTNYTIPDSVITIGNCAFGECDNLTGITLPDGVTSIGDYAFAWCENLTSITIPDSVASIGEYAFWLCESLTSVTIPDSVTSIGDYAFYGCDSLTSITIGDSVTTIGDWAFEYCDSLTSITVDSNNQYYSSDEYGVLFNKNKSTVVEYPQGNTRTSYTIPDSVTSIGDYAFYYSKLTHIIIPDSVISIGVSAFYECTNLVHVYYSNTEEQWNEIDIDNYNYYLSCANIHFNYKPGHYTETIITNPTCVNGGKKIYKCACGIDREEEIPALGHNFENDYCTVCGVSINHYYCEYEITEQKDATCYEDGYTTYTCKECGYYYTDVIYAYHEFGEGVVVEEATCTKNGYGTQTCTICGFTETYNIYVGHEYGDWVVTIEPTCTTEGEETHTCINCGNSESRTLEIQHNYGDWITTIEPTCTSKGEMKATCTKCGDSKTRGIPIKHNYQKVAEGQFECTECGNINTKYIELVPDTSHTNVGDIVTVDVNMKNCSELSSLTFDIIYDNEALEIVDYDLYDAFGGEIVNPNYTANKIRYLGYYLWTSLNNDDVTVMTISFKVLNTGGEIGFEIEEASDYDFQYIDIVNAGSIKIGEENLVSEDGITVIPENDDILPENTKINVLLLETKENSITYDITLTNNGTEIQPNGNVTVKIPVPNNLDGNNLSVYRLEEDGAYTDMNATFENGYMVFLTNHFSKYIITAEDPNNTEDVLIGDVNEDGKVNTLDRVILTRYIAKWEEYPEGSINTVAADVNGDGKINTLDRVILTRYIAKWEGYETLPYNA